MLMLNPTAPCGRNPVRPQFGSRQKESDLREESLPIAQQIENLKVKISLKERYNAVLREELEESKEGVGIVIKDLYNETVVLRQAMMEAINLEKKAVHAALRTHWDFQLALRSRTPEFALAWLDDKLFDHAKLLNELVCNLLLKRKRLYEIQNMVEQIQTWSFPGSVPWEREIRKKILITGVNYASMKVKLETAKVLNGKYKAIRERLKDEEDKYAPVIRGLEAQLAAQKNEAMTSRIMLHDAEAFEEDAKSTLAVIEKEAQVNRKKRRQRMRRVRAAVGKITKMNTVEGRHTRIILPAPQSDPKIINNKIKEKKRAIKEVEKLFETLSSALEVNSVPEIPTRFFQVKRVNENLNNEKSNLKMTRAGLKQKFLALSMIEKFFLYREAIEEREFQQVLQDYEKNSDELDTRITDAKKELGKTGDRICTITLALFALFDQLEGKIHHIRNTDNLIPLLPNFHRKLENMVEEVEELEMVYKKEFGDRILGSSSRRSTRHSQKLDHDSKVRKSHASAVETLLEADEASLQDDSSDEEEEIENLRVPTREEIKDKSRRIHEMGRIKRGLKESRFSM